MSLIESLIEHQPYSPVAPEIVLFEKRKPKQPVILNPRTLSFSEHTGFFRELFQSGPDTYFLVYNPSATFTNSSDLCRAVRVDCSDGRTKSVIFTYTNGGLKPYPEKTFDLEDPFVGAHFKSEIVFGGVQVDESLGSQGRLVSNWRTILYRGKTIPELKPFFTGPEGMKDIRPLKRPDGKIDVYTRPRSPGNEARGGDGQIGYRKFESLDQLENADPSSLDIENAPLLPFRFKKGHWGAVNHAQVLKGGKYQNWNLLTIHDGYEDPEDLLDYSTGFLLHNTETNETEELDIWITRGNLPQGPAKGKREEKVVFASETIIKRRKLRIWVGTSDAEIMGFEIPKPLALAA